MSHQESSRGIKGHQEASTLADDNCHQSRLISFPCLFLQYDLCNNGDKAVARCKWKIIEVLLIS